MGLAASATALGQPTDPSAIRLFPNPVLETPDDLTSVAVHDLNGDGHADLVSAHDPIGFTGSLSVRLGLGGGTFGPRVDYATPDAPRSIAIADFNQDGVADLAVASSSSFSSGRTISVLLGRGDGTFQPRTDLPLNGSAPEIAVGDVNGDGNPDLAAAVRTTASPHAIALLLGRGDGTFEPSRNVLLGIAVPTSIALADLNNDGALDVAVTLVQGAQVHVRFGNGDGSFPHGVNYPGPSGVTSVRAGDLDGDGDIDLAAISGLNGGDAASVLLNQGDGTFAPRSEFAVGVRPSGLLIVDANHDAVPDLVTPNSTGSSSEPSTVSVLLGLGDGTFAPPMTTLIGAPTISAATADLDNDGVTDLAVGADSPGYVSLVFGRGDGTFDTRIEVTTGGNPSESAAEDLNADGRPDLIISYPLSSAIGVLLNQGDNVFAPAVSFATGNSPRGIAVRDLNGDLRPDLAVACQNSNAVSVLLNQGDGAFAPPIHADTAEGTLDVRIGHLNDDAHPDLVTTNSGSNSISVLIGRGDGTFAPRRDITVPAAPLATAIADLDGDGDADLAVGSAAADSVSVLRNRGDGTFDPAEIIPLQGSVGRVVAADLDNDGDADLAALTTLADSLSVLLNQGSATFAPPQTHPIAASASDMTVADLDNDGLLDIAVANTGRATGGPSVSIFRGRGEGTLHTRTDFAAGINPTTVAVADFNNDGRPDLSLNNNSTDSVALLLNQHQAPPCPADFNADTTPGDIFDLFDFLTALDTGLDYNNDTTPADIFDLIDFLAVLEAGCP